MTEPVEGESRSDRADDAHDPAERLLRAHDQPELVLGGALTHERRGRGKQQGGPHRHQNEKDDEERHPGSARRQRRRQRHQHQPEPEQHGADLHRAHFAEAIVEPPDEPDAHQDTHDTEDGEEVSDRVLSDGVRVLQVQREHADHDVQRQHSDHVDPDHSMRRRRRVSHDLPQGLAHGPALRRRDIPPARCRCVTIRDARLRQPFPGEVDVDQHEGRGHDARNCCAEPVRHGADDRPDHHARTRRRRQPSQGLRPLGGRHGVRHVRLRDAGSPASQPLNDARGEQQPQRVGESEDQIRERGACKTDNERRPATVAIGDLPPHGRRDELGDREGRDQRPHHPLRRVEAQRVKGHEGGDQHEPQHVHEANGHQHPQALHRLAPTPRTTALSTIRITPKPAATPSSDTRRLDMISIAMGRLSGV